MGRHLFLSYAHSSYYETYYSKLLEQDRRQRLSYP